MEIISLQPSLLIYTYFSLNRPPDWGCIKEWGVNLETCSIFQLYFSFFPQIRLVPTNPVVNKNGYI